jgi:transposase
MKKTRDIVKLRRRCIRRKGEGVLVNEICTAAQIARRTFYNWWNRCEEGGFDNLIDRPRRPNIIHRTADETVRQIIDLRRETGWCRHRIAGYLRKNGVDVCHMTVYRVLCKEGLNHALEKPRIKRTYKRWQRKHPTAGPSRHLESHSGFSSVKPSPSKGSRVTSLANKQSEPNTGKEIFISSNQKHGKRNVLRVTKDFRTHGPDRLKRIYRKRSIIELVFAWLKEHLNLNNHKVRGLERITIHISYCLLCLLCTIEASRTLNHATKSLGITYWANLA